MPARAQPQSVTANNHGPRSIAVSNGGHSTSARAQLASKVNALLLSRGMSQRAASACLGIPQPKISAIQNYRLQGVSLERLMNALVALDQRIEIKVTPDKSRARSAIEVSS